MDLITGTNTVAVIDLDDASYRYKAVMGENALTLYFSSAEHIEIPVGSYVDYEGERYTLYKPQNLVKNGKRKHEYTLILESQASLAKKWKVRNPVDRKLKFSYTATPRQHLELLVACLNEHERGWSIGACIDSAHITVSYNHTYIYDALASLADKCKTEFNFTNKEVSLCKLEFNKDNPLPLSYGRGNGFKSGVGRTTGEMPVEMVLVQGTDRNINPSSYGSSTLLLPKSQRLEYEGRVYTTDETGTAVYRADKPLSNGREDSLDLSEIYPSRVGKVSSVIVVDAEKNFFDFTDDSIPESLDFEKYLIAGESMTVIFQNGALITREFEVKYIHEETEVKGEKKAGRRFEIVPAEIDGVTMPGGVLIPSVGDEYAVFGMQLPDEYICDNDSKTGASWDMFREAARYLYEHEALEFEFKGTLDNIWSKRRWLEVGGKIKLGGYIRFSDEEFQPEGVDIRITGIKSYINNPYKPEIELSSAVVGGSISSDLNKPSQNEVVIGDKYKASLEFTKRRFRDARETMEMLEDAMLNFSGAISPVAVQTMQMLVGDESLQFRFVNSKTNPVAVNHVISYNPETMVLTAPAGILQHMTLGISNVSKTHAASEYKFWDMVLYNSPSLNVPEKKYYLYAKVSKSNTTGTFLLSEAAIGMEQVAGYYHLLVGILNSEYDGDRSFVTLYGFTEILPGRITTDKIVSTDGKTYFDLVQGIIGGNIKIMAGSTGLENFEEYEVLSNQISALNKAVDETDDAIDNLEGYIDGAFADGIISEAEAKAIEKYINTVNNTKAGVEATYNKLYANSYLSGTPKTNLLNAKVTLFGAIDDLLAAINTAIEDGITTKAEKNAVDSKFTAFNSALSSFNTAVEAANKAIQDKLKEYSDLNTAELEVLSNQISALNKAVDETDDAIDNLEGYIDGAFADGIISEAEAKAIEKYINTVNNTKAGVEATYNKLYANSYLSGTPKTNLLNAKVTLFGAIDDLLAAINTAIEDGITTKAEKNAVDSKFTAFNSALSSFNTAVEAANKAIQDKLKEYSDLNTAELEVLSNQISAQVTRIDNINNTISYAGWITKADGNTWWASKTMENGDTLISYINQAAGSTTIASSKINLVGAVTFNSFSTALQGTINGKADSSDLGDLASKDSVSKAMLDSVLSSLIDGKADASGLGSLAYKSAVESAMLGSTIIVGGYLNTDYIKVKKIEAIEGTIAGFHISGNGLINTGFNNDAYLIFRNDIHKTFAGIGGNVLPSSTGLRAVARFENHDEEDFWYMGANYAMLVSAQGGRENVAIQFNGGSLSCLAIKTQIIGHDNVVQSTAPTTKYVTLDRNVASVYVSTQFNWKASSSETSYTSKTRNVYLTLPTMDVYDDGHVIKIKRGSNDGSWVYVSPGGSYRMVYNSSTGKYVRTYGTSYIMYDNASYGTTSSKLGIESQGDAMEFVYHRDLQIKIDNVTYYGCWIQYKHPRSW